MDPQFLEDYLNYMRTIKGRSEGTVREYSYDLRRFLKYLTLRLEEKSHFTEEELQEVDISKFPLETLETIKISDLHAYLGYLDRVYENNVSTRSRKVSSIRSFYNYLHKTLHLLRTNPADQLEAPRSRVRHPVYLELEEALKLLESAQSLESDEYRTRDFAILTLFLNCGLRLAELCSIRVSDLKKDRLSVIGKGNKERTIYLNEASIQSIESYLAFRPKVSTDALFISKRGNPMSRRAVQHRVDYHIKKAGFDPKKYSTHKLRHTAATLMYKYGKIDIRTLQQILGHANVSTTQIYTHLDEDILREAVSKNPLAQMVPKSKK